MLIVEQSEFLSHDGSHQAGPGREPLAQVGGVLLQSVLAVLGQVVEVERDVLAGDLGDDQSLSWYKHLTRGLDGLEHS